MRCWGPSHKFVTSKPLKGIAEDPNVIRRLLRDNPEVLAMFEEAIAEKHGGDRRSEAAKPSIKIDNVKLDNQGGNSLPYTVRRLEKTRPDLFEQVKAGQLSANQAAIKAGLRKVKTPLEQIKALPFKLILPLPLGFLPDNPTLLPE